MAKTVYAKATDGKEIRKFRIDTDVTFDTLKKQVAPLFPTLADGADFNLQYRDTDGDVISISTDEEVQTALNHLPTDETWLLQAVRVPKRIQQRPRLKRREETSTKGEVIPFGGSLLGRILDDRNPFWTPEASLLDWKDEVEEEWKLRTEQLRKMHNDHMKIYEEQMKKAEADLQKALNERRSGSGGEVANSGKPKWHVQTFGSWDPQVMESPHGTRTVIGPVGYHMYWGYSDPEEPKSQGEQTTQQQEDQKKEETKPTAQQQGDQKKEETKPTAQQQGDQKDETKPTALTHSKHKKEGTKSS